MIKIINNEKISIRTIFDDAHLNISTECLDIFIGSIFNLKFNISLTNGFCNKTKTNCIKILSMNLAMNGLLTNI